MISHMNLKFRLYFIVLYSMNENIVCFFKFRFILNWVGEEIKSYIQPDLMEMGIYLNIHDHIVKFDSNLMACNS
jgi:hypothetical protein